MIFIFLMSQRSKMGYTHVFFSTICHFISSLSQPFPQRCALVLPQRCALVLDFLKHSLEIFNSKKILNYKISVNIIKVHHQHIIIHVPVYDIIIISYHYRIWCDFNSNYYGYKIIWHETLKDTGIIYTCMYVIVTWRQHLWNVSQKPFGMMG